MGKWGSGEVGKWGSGEVGKGGGDRGNNKKIRNWPANQKLRIRNCTSETSCESEALTEADAAELRRDEQGHSFS